MLTAVAEPTTEFKKIPPGNYIARCFSLVDLGRQEVEWSGVTKLQRKIAISWEVFGEDEDGSPLTTTVDDQEMPMTISKRFTLSLSDKSALRKDLESWRGKQFSEDELKGFDLTKLIGVYCMINVTHSAGVKDKQKTYANVAAITPLPKSLKDHKPDPVHPSRVFDMDNPDMEVFSQLSERMQEIIQSSPDWIDNRQEAESQQSEATQAMGDAAKSVPF